MILLMKHPTIDKAYAIIQSFPVSYNGQRYITLKNGKKLYFNIFIRKYGLDNSSVQYSVQDVIRRMRPIEFIDYIIKDYDMVNLLDHKYQIESKILSSYYQRSHQA